MKQLRTHANVLLLLLVTGGFGLLSSCGPGEKDGGSAPTVLPTERAEDLGSRPPTTELERRSVASALASQTMRALAEQDWDWLAQELDWPSTEERILGESPLDSLTLVAACQVEPNERQLLARSGNAYLFAVSFTPPCPIQDSADAMNYLHLWVNFLENGVVYVPFEEAWLANTSMNRELLDLAYAAVRYADPALPGDYDSETHCDESGICYGGRSSVAASPIAEPLQPGVYDSSDGRVFFKSIAKALGMGGVLVGYNCTSCIGDLRSVVQPYLDGEFRVMVVPSGMIGPESGTVGTEEVALIAWGRKELLSAGSLDLGEVRRFIEAHERRFVAWSY